MPKSIGQTIALGTVLIDPDMVGESEHRSVVETITDALNLPDYDEDYPLNSEESAHLEAILHQFRETCTRGLVALERARRENARKARAVRCHGAPQA